MPSFMRCVVAVLLCAAYALASAVPAEAGAKRTPENCKAVGAVTVHCYKCFGDQEYLGIVAVLAGYEESNGDPYCIEASPAKDACSRAFGEPSRNIGFYAKFKMGANTMEETYDPRCVNNVGKP